MPSGRTGEPYETAAASGTCIGKMRIVTSGMILFRIAPFYALKPTESSYAGDP